MTQSRTTFLQATLAGKSAQLEHRPGAGFPDWPV